MDAARKMKSVMEDRKLNGIRGSQDVFQNSGRKSLFIEDSQYNTHSLTLEHKSVSSQSVDDYKIQKSNSLSSLHVKRCDNFPLIQKSQDIDIDGLKFIQPMRDIATMTDYTLDINVEIEFKCNKLFGQFVACEISNISGKARYEKMKEIIGLFQSPNN